MGPGGSGPSYLCVAVLSHEHTQEEAGGHDTGQTRAVGHGQAGALAGGRGRGRRRHARAATPASRRRKKRSWPGTARAAASSSSAQRARREPFDAGAGGYRKASAWARRGDSSEARARVVRAAASTCPGAAPGRRGGAATYGVGSKGKSGAEEEPHWGGRGRAQGVVEEAVGSRDAANLTPDDGDQNWGSWLRATAWGSEVQLLFLRRRGRRGSSPGLPVVAHGGRWSRQ